MAGGQDRDRAVPHAHDRDRGGQAERFEQQEASGQRTENAPERIDRQQSAHLPPYPAFFATRQAKQQRQDQRTEEQRRPPEPERGVQAAQQPAGVLHDFVALDRRRHHGEQRSHSQ